MDNINFYTSNTHNIIDRSNLGVENKEIPTYIKKINALSFKVYEQTECFIMKKKNKKKMVGEIKINLL